MTGRLRFLEESIDLISSVQTSVLNTWIVAALLLTIVLPLMLSSPYKPDDLRLAREGGSVFSDDAAFFMGAKGSMWVSATASL